MMNSDTNNRGSSADISNNEKSNDSDSGEYLQPENEYFDSETDVDADYSASTAASRDNVFSNALIWRNLEKCLNFTDLKYLRLVDKKFNRNIMEETNFKSRVLINMKACMIEQEVFKPTTAWKHFRIECFSEQDLYEDLSEDENEDDKTSGIADLRKGNEGKVDVNKGHRDLPKEEENIVEGEYKPNLDWISEVLKAAESLTVITICDFEVKVAILPSLKELLEAPDQLRSLSLDLQTIDRNYKGTFKTLSNRIQSMLENLTEFHILPSVKYLEDVYEEVVGFAQATTVLSTVLKNLRVFTVPKFQFENNYEGIKHVHKIIEENKTHLTTLELVEPHIWTSAFNQDALVSTPTVAKLTFSQLKSLKLVFHHVDDMKKKSKVMEFLKAQPLLERLELSISPKCSTELCTYISTMSNLRILRLKTKGFDAQELHSWAFLNNLARLEEFYFVLGKSDRVSSRGIDVTSILNNLPKSVRRLSINGISHGDAYLNQSLRFNDIKLNPNSITHLNLSKCAYFVTDNIMECVCRNFGMLRVLDVAHNQRLSDFGFTGINPADPSQQSSFSIKDLKGLRYLKLERCEITDMTLIQAIQFLELIHLDLTDCRFVTENGCMAVVTNNPSLETLKTHQTFSSEFLSKFPRLKPPLKLDFEDEVYTSDDELSDSDGSLASDLDEYGNFDSDDLDGFSDDDQFGFHFQFGYNDYEDYVAAELDFDEW